MQNSSDRMQIITSYFYEFISIIRIFYGINNL